MDEDLKQLIETTAAQTTRQFEELYERLDGVAVEIHTRIDGVEARLDAKIEKMAAETRRHFDITAEGLRHDIRGVIDGVDLNTQKIDRLEAKVDEIAAEYDRRLTRLEAAQWSR